MRQTILAVLGMLLATVAAQAQEWPSRAVTIVVPFAAGATPDIVARIVAERLQAKLGQSFIVENRPGASGNLGTNAVAQAAPDGYTIGVSIVGPLALNTLLFARMPYDPARDLALITVLASQPSVLVVSSQLGVTTVADLMALLRRYPGKYNYGSIGTGSLSHLAMEAIAAQSGTKPVHIPYRGSPAAVTALIRSDVQIGILPAGAVAPHAATGQFRMIAVSSAQRSQFLPDLPTLREAGISGVEADAWIGLIAPRQTSDAIKAKLERDIRAILTEPETREKLRLQLMEAVGNSSEEFRGQVDAELARWTPIIRANNIRIEQ
ncbi:tripartite tricarboxylate transporter substrate binding protein [Phreatobacter stygius]|uniref:Tripartite tricarboxylate transporter substrate binding protein n=2 Tax=Phreatobacter stygius TaxID=1940610 RepID=A0A4D7BIR1_9HYPH|nr:tripartite tricarboxylate transporter substrate binding protein [Phreatobacter stygius]